MKRVMTVDDSVTARKTLATVLSEAGYLVVPATDGVDALDKIRVQEIDLLVTDLNMPGMDGVELIRNVRSLPGKRFMPIIMLTSDTQPERKQAGKAAGASGWVCKPFRPQQLLTIMQMICPAA